MKKRLFLGLLTGILSTLSLQVSAKQVDNAKVIADFREHVEAVPYLNEENMDALNDELREHIKCLQNWSDKDAYIKEHDLQNYLKRQKGSLQYYQNSAYAMIDDFLLRYADQGIEDEKVCRDSMMAVLNDRTGMCETNLNLLERELNSEQEATPLSTLSWPMVAVIVVVLICVIILVWIVSNATFGRQRTSPATPHTHHQQRTRNRSAPQDSHHHEKAEPRRRDRESPLSQD